MESDVSKNEDKNKITNENKRKKELKQFINSIIDDFLNKKSIFSKVELLEKMLYNQKRFLNMVVHDLRSPCESI